MKLKNYILILVILLISQGIKSQEQVIDTVCAGDVEVMYAVETSLIGMNSTFAWSVDGGTFAPYSAAGDTILVNWGNTPGDFNVQVIEISDFGCEGNPVAVRVMINSTPAIDLGDEESICEGEEYIFDVGSGFSSYNWQDGSTGQTFITDQAGNIWVTATNEFGCSSSDTVNLTVHGLPQVDLGNDTTVCGTAELVLDAGDYSFYSWSTGEISNEITLSEGARQVWVEVEDYNGCVSSDTLLLSRCNPEDFLGDITSAFTPNGDGENDVWKIRNIQFFPDAEVVIYDRWGRLVYQCDGGYDNETVAWDGTNPKGKRMPMDSYYYVIKLHHDNGEPIAGTVTIVR